MTLIDEEQETVEAFHEYSRFTQDELMRIAHSQQKRIEYFEAEDKRKAELIDSLMEQLNGKRV